jgi:hypothetical protein
MTMSALTRLLPPERRALVADALVLTTATAAALLGLLTLVAEQAGDSGWYSWVSSLTLLGVLLVCPFVAWRLHGRHGSRTSAVGAGVGLLGGGGVLWGLLMVVATVGIATSWATGGTVSEGVASLVLVAALLAALVLALDVDAVRDLARARTHVGIDVARLVATVLVVGTAAGALWYALANPGEAPAELLAFGLAAGVVGAAVVLGADLAVGASSASASPPPAAPAT